ncbi:hypothetical protein FN846DRAFT_902867 [Sphaerosporella brunnea]|uniref:Uncharacterized protein n=1 Tax=Sphaerosporella brunnea TaxID=1250544 RepID=A0A5J5F8J1_9PEZI|nr:hypothetical protein FN846DRAFT_902867 [Sphaerosporella brunnea]
MSSPSTTRKRLHGRFHSCPSLNEDYISFARLELPRRHSFAFPAPIDHGESNIPPRTSEIHPHLIGDRQDAIELSPSRRFSEWSSGDKLVETKSGRGVAEALDALSSPDLVEEGWRTQALRGESCHKPTATLPGFSQEISDSETHHHNQSGISSAQEDNSGPRDLDSAVHVQPMQGTLQGTPAGPNSQTPQASRGLTAYCRCIFEDGEEYRLLPRGEFVSPRFDAFEEILRGRGITIFKDYYETPHFLSFVRRETSGIRQIWGTAIKEGSYTDEVIEGREVGVEAVVLFEDQIGELYEYSYVYNGECLSVVAANLAELARRSSTSKLALLQNGSGIEARHRALGHPHGHTVLSTLVPL